MLPEVLHRLPKAVLHDHLDGGLRVQTVLDLAAATGYDGLPTDDQEELGAWFYQGGAPSLERYLEAFVHTLGVMQTPEAVHRVAYESVLDHAADGVVYAELRFAPSLLTTKGMTLHDAMRAAAAGVRDGEGRTGTVARLIIDAMRNMDDSEEVARAVVELDDPVIVGFDLAGPESGYPPSDHLPALRLARESSLHVTIHAGEAEGPHSMWNAWAKCGAQRLGHGHRIIDDTVASDGQIRELGRLARYFLDARTPLEMCISSNVHIGAYPDVGAHPVGKLHRAGFCVTLNTDNRLMSATSMSQELQLAVEHHGFGVDDLRQVTVQALRAAFGPWEERLRLIHDVVEPAYDDLVAS